MWKQSKSRQKENECFMEKDSRKNVQDNTEEIQNIKEKLHGGNRNFLRKTCIGCYIPSYLATITNGVQETTFDPTALARPLQSGYSHVHGKLKTSKMAKIETLTPYPPPALKQIFRKTNHVGVFGGSLWTFSHHEIQINRTFFFSCLVSLFDFFFIF